MMLTLACSLVAALGIAGIDGGTRAGLWKAIELMALFFAVGLSLRCWFIERGNKALYERKCRELDDIREAIKKKASDGRQVFCDVAAGSPPTLSSPRIQDHEEAYKRLAEYAGDFVLYISGESPIRPNPKRLLPPPLPIDASFPDGSQQ